MKKVFRSNIKGAVFVTRDTFYKHGAEVWHVSWGLQKERGCVQFFPAVSGKRYMMDYLVTDACIARYNDCPETGEAWLVYPCKNGIDYWWEPVHDLIDFT